MKVAYAFVDFEDPQDASNAIAEMNSRNIFGTGAINVRPAKQKRKTERGDRGERGNGGN